MYIYMYAVFGLAIPGIELDLCMDWARLLCGDSSLLYHCTLFYVCMSFPSNYSFIIISTLYLITQWTGLMTIINSFVHVWCSLYIIKLLKDYVS